MTREPAIDILRSANLAGVLREAADLGIEALSAAIDKEQEAKSHESE